MRPALKAELVLGGAVAGAPGRRRDDVLHRRRRAQRRADRGEVLRPARRGGHDGPAGPGGSAAVAGPQAGHGPAHRLAPVGRDRAGVDHRLPRDVRAARLRAPGRRHGARDVPQPGGRDRFAAGDVRRRDRRRRGGRLHAMGAKTAALRGLPLRAPPPVRRDRARARPPGAGRDLLRRPARRRLLVDDVGAGHRLASRVQGGRADPPQPAPPLPGRRGRPGVRRRRVGLRHRP